MTLGSLGSPIGEIRRGLIQWFIRSHRPLRVPMVVGLVAPLIGNIQQASGEQLFKDSKALMGTVVTITVSGCAEEQAKAGMEAAFAEVDRIDHLLSNFRQDGLIARLNRNGHEHKVLVPKEIFKLIRQAIQVGEASNGAFDVTIWPVSRLWAFDQGGRKPGTDEVRKSLSLVGYKSLLLNELDESVGFAREGMGIDLGAIAKGWAADRAMATLEARGIANAIVDAGGDLRVGGTRAGRGFWRIGVQDPRDPERLLFTFDLANTAIATSGDYERWFEQDGVRYHHILDPATGMPASGCRSVTVLAATAAEADAAATAAFVLGPQRGLAFLCARPGLRGVIVDAAGALHWTDEPLAKMARPTDRR